MTALRTFSYGGGVQSNAALVLAATGRIDFPTFLFANVGDDSEWPATLTYVHDVAMPYADAHGLTIHELRHIKQRGENAGEEETLYGLLTRESSRSVEIPVHLPRSGPGRAKCSERFKAAVVARWCRDNGATRDDPAVIGMGITTDEIQRAKVGTDPRFPIMVKTNPLLDLNLTRADCVEIIRTEGLPLPPKSSCWFCPLSSPRRYQTMRHENPVQFADAVALERTLGDRRERLGRDRGYLTAKCEPLDVVTSDDEQLGFDMPGSDCESGYCMT